MSKATLNLSYSGSAFPASKEFTQGDKQYWSHAPETERITGAFRIVDQDNDAIYIGNGEAPEKYWMIWEWDLD